MLKGYYCDFHIHIGRSEKGSPIKITAARDLTFANIVKESVHRKGLDMLGIVDCASPKVLEDIEALISSGELYPLAGGGYGYKDKVTVLLGAEVESKEKTGQAHCLCFFPTIEKITEFSNIMGGYITNISLSSQQCGLPMEKILEIVLSLEGILIPAHIFTPYKSIFGRCASSLEEIFSNKNIKNIKAVELGLSSDSYYADFLRELSDVSFLTNSDAHSLPKIGREYNLIKMAKPSFREFELALTRKEGRKVQKNFGLDPKLGKYHRTFCEVCEKVAEDVPPVLRCSNCGEEARITVGVLDRLYQLNKKEHSKSPSHRPPYIYQVPLQFLPKVGPKTINKLIDALGTEMEILHTVPIEDIKKLVGPTLGTIIEKARKGELALISGGGGNYGKIGG